MEPAANNENGKVKITALKVPSKLKIRSNGRVTRETRELSVVQGLVLTPQVLQIKLPDVASVIQSTIQPTAGTCDRPWRTHNLKSVKRHARPLKPAQTTDILSHSSERLSEYNNAQQLPHGSRILEPHNTLHNPRISQPHPSPEDKISETFNVQYPQSEMSLSESRSTRQTPLTTGKSSERHNTLHPLVPVDGESDRTSQRLDSEEKTSELHNTKHTPYSVDTISDPLQPRCADTSAPDRITETKAPKQPHTTNRQPRILNQFPCHVCKQRFPCRRSLNTHRLIHVEPPKCQDCGKEVDYYSTLLRHRCRVCRHCGKRFQNMLALKNHPECLHIRVVTAEVKKRSKHQTFRANSNSRESFLQKLKPHITTQRNGQKETLEIEAKEQNNDSSGLICKVCKEQFDDAFNLTTHMRFHSTPVKVYSGYRKKNKMSNKCKKELLEHTDIPSPVKKGPLEAPTMRPCSITQGMEMPTLTPLSILQEQLPTLRPCSLNQDPLKIPMGTPSLVKQEPMEKSTETSSFVNQVPLNMPAQTTSLVKQEPMEMPTENTEITPLVNQEPIELPSDTSIVKEEATNITTGATSFVKDRSLVKEEPMMDTPTQTPSLVEEEPMDMPTETPSFYLLLLLFFI